MADNRSTSKGKSHPAVRADDKRHQNPGRKGGRSESRSDE